jgi:hypothetical protein
MDAAQAALLSSIKQQGSNSTAATAACCLQQLPAAPIEPAASPAAEMWPHITAGCAYRVFHAAV